MAIFIQCGLIPCETDASPFVRGPSLAISGSLCIKNIDSFSLCPLYDDGCVWTTSITMTDTGSNSGNRGSEKLCHQLDSSQSHRNGLYHRHLPERPKRLGQQL